MKRDHGVVVKRSSDKRLDKLKRTFRSETVLLGAIERHILTRAFEQDRASDVIHPSEICKSDTCPRMLCYRIGGVEPDFSDVEASWWMLRMFEEGHDIHDKYQGWLWDMRKLYGYFECLQCDARWYGHSPQECIACGSGRKKLRYNEAPARNERHMLSGHMDGVVDEGIVEIKSIGVGTVRIEAPGFHDKFLSGEWTLQDMWNAIKRPFPTHVKQGMIYCFCKGIDSAIFIYECKWNQAVKEFTVRYNAELIAPILDLCRDIKYAVETNRPLDRPSWAVTPEAPACKACPYRKLCWSDESQTTEHRKRTKIRRIPAHAS